MKRLLNITSLILLLFILPILANAALSPDDLHNIKLKDIFISDDQLKCPDHLSVLVEVQNEGKTGENVFIELSNEKLKLSEISQIFNIKPGSIEVITFDLNLPNSIEGEQEFEAQAFFNKESHRIFRSFKFEECEEEKPVVKDITNLEPPKRETSYEGYTISAQTIFIIAMLIIVFILAILYIVKVYLEK